MTHKHGSMSCIHMYNVAWQHRLIKWSDPEIDNLADDLDQVFDAVDAWYEDNLGSCSKSQYRLERQVTRISVISFFAYTHTCTLLHHLLDDQCRISLRPNLDLQVHLSRVLKSLLSSKITPQIECATIGSTVYSTSWIFNWQWTNKLLSQWMP